MRVLIVVLLLALTSQVMRAQGIVGGRLIEASSARPLACWKAELRDAQSRVLAIMYTRPDGTFEFPAPASGSHTFVFIAYGLQAVQSGFESRGPSADFERDFEVKLLLTDSTGATTPLIAEGAPRSVRGRGVPRYPPELRLQGVEGGLRAAFAIDSSGRVMQDNVFIWGVTHPAFEAAVRRALLEMRFSDVARPDGTACAFIASPYLFRLSLP